MKSKVLRFESLETRQLLSVVATPLPHSVVAPALVSQVVYPSITSIGGTTDPAFGISNGLVKEPYGITWNGFRVVNDTTAYYHWTVNGSGFGTAQGTVTLNGRSVPILAWSPTSITIAPSGAQFSADPTKPWNWQPAPHSPNATLTIKTAGLTGMQVSKGMDVVPAISEYIYGQCTYGAAYERYVLGKSPFSPTYSGYTSFSTNWVPQRGDQLVWIWNNGSNTHTAVITGVSKTVSGNKTTYTLTLYEWNLHSQNEVSTATTTFSLTKQANGQFVVTTFPWCATNASPPANTTCGYHSRSY